MNAETEIQLLDNGQTMVEQKVNGEGGEGGKHLKCS